jgi:pimeloyl-ACP methyl ester carboxylesterase
VQISVKTARWAVCALLLLSASPSTASTSDLEREKIWADQIVDFLIAGEAVWLEAKGVRFLAIATRPQKTQPPPERALVLLHGRGVHPAWGFIDTLRIDLADRGWHTLSLQMPILGPDVPLREYAATFPEAYARIEAGIRYLRQRGVKRIYLLGHSTGAAMAVAYAAESPRHGINGIIGVGISTVSDGGRVLHPARLLPELTLPVLDIYGSDDLPHITGYAKARRDSGTRNKNYRQLEVRGANHFFTDHYPVLRKEIFDWLDRYSAPMP